MKMKSRREKFRKGERGQITLDFLFGCVLILGVSALLGAITFALTLTEVLQYVSFSGARNYFAADIDPATQAEMAEGKVTVLLKQLPFLNGAQQAGWIKVQKHKADNYSDAGTGYQSSIGAATDTATYRRTQFVGYQITFTLPIMGIKLPLFGQVMQPPEGEEDFTGVVSSFIMREPTTSECMQYTKGIYDALRQQGGYTNAPAVQFQPINDNGC